MIYYKRKIFDMKKDLDTLIDKSIIFKLDLSQI